MIKKTKKFLAVLLSLLLIFSGVPFVSLASETGTLTIGADAAAEGIEIDSDVAFTYDVLINDAAYSGTAAGDDGNTYTVTDGKVTIPYDVSVTISDIAAGSSYSVKRMGYDNEKYALVGESEALTGKVAENTYFGAVNGVESVITADEFNQQTADGTNLEYTVYKDAEGNVYAENEVGYRGGYTGPNDSTSGNYAYALDSLTQKTVKISVTYGALSTTTSGKLVKTYNSKAPASYVISCEGFESASGSVEGSASLPIKATAESTAKSNAGIELAAVFTEYIEQCFNTIENETGKKTVYESTGKLIITKGGYCFGDFNFANDTSAEQEITISAFTLTEDISTYAYRVEYGEADKTATFAVNLTPAPTGTFQINFALDDTVPTGYENAVFELKSADGRVLTEGEDYTLAKAPYTLEDITKGVLKWGISIYTFSGIKAGSYTISQKSTANGYKFDETAEYAFEVARADGAVTGENFDTSAINSKIPCLYNADKSINILITKIKLFLFMNESFTLAFNVKDQNKEPVEGSQFMMVERDALISLVGQIASLGVNNIGNIDIGSIAGSIGNLDFSNIDAGTILAILETVLDLIPELPEGTKLTIPAILMASSNDDGIVKFNNASNMMNVLDTVAKLGDSVDAEVVAETIKNLLGSSVPEEYLDALVKLAKYMGILDVHTGIPAAYFVLFNSSAPDGYERNGVMYTIKVGNDGNATTSAGILIPVIADVINERFNLDIYEILVNEEEFENASAAIKEAFGTFAEYSTFVIDLVGSFIEDDLAGIITKDQLEDFKANIYEVYEEYDNLSEAVGEAVKELNESIRGELTEDWTYTNNRYFLTVDVNAADCGGNDVAMNVVDANGTEWYIASGKAILPYGTYTFSLSENADLILKDGSSSYTLVINDHNASYAVTYTYHVPEVTEKVEPDCENTGLTEGSHCKYCGDILAEQDEIEALGHKEATIEAVKPTCTETGLTEGKYCTVCEKVLVEQQVVDALGHTEVPIGEYILPTCTEDGITDGVMCEVCGEILEAREILDNHGHMPAGDIDSAYAATCTEAGKDADFVCWVCGVTIVEGAVIPPLGHDEVIDEEVKATCTQTGLTEGVHCGVCGEILTAQQVTDATGHTETAIGEAKEPTCTEEGITAGVKCAVCGEILTAQQAIEKIPHTAVTDEAVEPTCTETGLSQGSHCAVCGEVLIAQQVLAAKGHSYEIVIVPSTITEEGKVNKVCSDCGHTYTVTLLPKLVDESSEYCTSPVAGFCKTYNNYFNYPVLGPILTFCHNLVHYFHSVR